MEKKILIVNYQPRKLEQWEILFKDIDGEVLTASDGEKALNIFNELHPDIVIIDPMLPKKSGFDVIKEIKDQSPDTKVVVVASVHKGVKYQSLAKNTYHVDEFLEEPVDEDLLKEKVTQLIGFSIDSMVLEDLMGSGKPKHTNKKTGKGEVNQDNTVQNKQDSPKTAKSKEGKTSDNQLNLQQTVNSKKKKSSAKRRFEEIIEETLSGKVIDDLPKRKIKNAKPKDTEKVFTSEELFSDVISEVEESFIDQTLDSLVEEHHESSKKKKPDSVEQAIEEKLEKTLSGLKVDKKKKTKKAIIESKVSKKEEKKVDEPEKDEEPKKAKKEKGIEYGNYLLLDKVATGGMAELFKAKRRGVQGFQKIVAIKRILPHLVENEEFVTMFIDEAKLAAQLNHPNIAQIYDLGKIEDTFYIAMEYVEGHDLRKMLKKCKEKGCHIPEPIVLFVASKVLSALDYAHRKKGLDNKDLHIVHRDISPQNVILSLEGDVKLVDFGIAKAATKASQTQAGALKGKLLYMSPEQAWGEKVDKRSDLFSLGAVMYEALTGKKCFLADSEINILEKVRNVDYVPLKKVNPKVSDKTVRIIEKALTKDVKERYQSAKEMEQEILDVLNSLPYTVNERVVSEFVNALYKEDMNKLKELSEKLVIESSVLVEEKPEDKTEKESALEKEDVPVEEYSISESDIDSEDIDEIDERRANTGTVVVPNPEDLEKYEKEEIKKLEKEEKSSKTVLIIGVVIALVVVAIAGYFISTKKKAEKPKAKPQVAQSEEKPKGEEVNNPGQGNAVSPESTQQNSQKVGQTTKTEPKTAVGMEKKKQQLVEKLTKKKIAEQKKKYEEQLARQRKLLEEKRRKLEEERRKAAALEAKKKKSKPKRTNSKPKTSNVANQTKVVNNQPATSTIEKQSTTEIKPSKNQTVSSNEATTKKPQVQQQSQQNVENPVQKVENKPQKQKQPEPAKVTPVKVQQPQVKEGDLVPITDDVVKPVPVKKVKPKYTLAAKRKRVHGTIIAQGLIDENGNVVEVRILRKMRNSFGLEKEVIKALKKWKFQPATKNGVKVKVYDTFLFKF